MPKRLEVDTRTESDMRIRDNDGVLSDVRKVTHFVSNNFRTLACKWVRENRYRVEYVSGKVEIRSSLPVIVGP